MPPLNGTPCQIPTRRHTAFISDHLRRFKCTEAPFNPRMGIRVEATRSSLTMGLQQKRATNRTRYLHETSIMRLALEDRWIEKLRSQPESGMGYQRVRVRLRDGRIIAQAVVLNGRFLDFKEDVGSVTSPDIVDLEVESR